MQEILEYFEGWHATDSQGQVMRISLTSNTFCWWHGSITSESFITAYFEQNKNEKTMFI